MQRRLHTPYLCASRIRAAPPPEASPHVHTGTEMDRLTLAAVLLLQTCSGSSAAELPLLRVLMTPCPGERGCCKVMLPWSDEVCMRSVYSHASLFVGIARELESRGHQVRWVSGQVP